MIRTLSAVLLMALHLASQVAADASREVAALQE
jgi:hypothetical protein